MFLGHPTGRERSGFRRELQEVCPLLEFSIYVDNAHSRHSLCFALYLHHTCYFLLSLVCVCVHCEQSHSLLCSFPAAPYLSSSCPTIWLINNIPFSFISPRADSLITAQQLSQKYLYDEVNNSICFPRLRLGCPAGCSYCMKPPKTLRNPKLTLYLGLDQRQIFLLPFQYQ